MGINDNFTNRTSIMFLIFGLVMIAVSGIVFSLIYYSMDTVQTSFEAMDCEIEGNAFFDDCQGWFTMVLYPFLALKDILVYLSMIFIFVLILGMLLTGYNSGFKPWLMGIMILLNIGLTYASIWVANIYRLLLENDIIRTALIEFSVYNKIMLNFPWFVFITSLFSIAFGLINWQRSRTNTPYGDLDY